MMVLRWHPRRRVPSARCRRPRKRLVCLVCVLHHMPRYQEIRPLSFCFLGQSAKSPTPKKPKGATATLSDAALKAVTLVDEAAAKLPSEASLKISFMPEASYVARAPDEPPHAGSKALPAGHMDCLTGKTFVISGVMDSLKREEVEDFIRRHNGKVTGNVSGRTSFLVMGQHAGRSKHTAAKSKGTKIIDEDGLIALVASTAGLVRSTQAEGTKMEDGKSRTIPGALESQGIVSGQSRRAAMAQSLPDSGKTPLQLQQTSQTVPAPRAPSSDDQLWVEKWRPKTTAELVGNPGHIGTLRLWLQQWDAIHLHGREPVPSGGGGYGRGGRAPDLKKRAVLISGPPGIGKTTAALCLCRELGLQPVEVNASDTRSKADASVLKGVGGKLSNAIKELSTNTAVSFAGGDPARGRNRLCLIMDEVDGMSGGDRGGVADLIQTIKTTRVPIVAICNDKYSSKLRSLRNHCLELEFRKYVIITVAWVVPEVDD